MNETLASRKLNTNNHSGYKGIHWDKVRCKWYVKISTKGKSLFLGRFKDFGDALEVREKAEAAISLLKSVDAMNIHISSVKNGNKAISGILPKNRFNFKFSIQLDILPNQPLQRSSR